MIILAYLNLPGYNIEYTNRIGREKGGVCMYISDKVKYKLRKDLCPENSNYESYFIEIESKSDKNVVVGVVYRAHTPIDNFVTDFDPVLKTLNQERKKNFILWVILTLISKRLIVIDLPMTTLNLSILIP